MRELTPAALARVCLVIALLLCMVVAARQGIGAWYFRQGSPQAIETAIRWDPGNPEYYDALAAATHLYADSGNSAEIVPLYETATRLSPWCAQYWADLGSAYDWAGRRNDALRALNRALALAPNSPQVNWRLANFYIRARNPTDGLRALRKVLAADTVPRRDVFALAANATPDNTAILREMLPATAPLLFDFLDFRTATGDMDSAHQVWRRLLELNLSFELNQSFPFLDGLIRHRRLETLADTWTALAARFPSQILPRKASGNAITNGSFEFPALNGGLDWRVNPVEGAVVSADSQEHSDGAGSLRIEFDGTRNLNYGEVFQYVLVQPEQHYRFSGDMRVRGITTDNGPRFDLFDAYDMGILHYATEGMTGTSGWTERRIDFKTNRQTGLLIVRVARPPSRKFDNRIAGTVWIDRLSLRPER